MVVTKLQVQGAGKPASHHRRQLILGFAAGLMAPTASLMAAPGSVITPARSYAGARLLQRVNQNGMPEARFDTFGAMTLFVFPSALAATPMDLYIVDPGLGALLRYDPMLDALAVISGARVSQQSRLAALPDGSVILSNGGAIPAKRYSRSGRVLQTIDPQNGPAFFDDVVADSNSGRFYGLDRVQGRLEEIMPHGRGGTVLPPGLIPDLPMAMAMDAQRLYVAGRACGCVEAIDLFGSRGKSTVVDELGNVTALAANDGWLVIADSTERQVRIYREGILLAEPDFSELRLVNPQGMAIANNHLYVADPGNRRIASFILRP
jgi:hypothetical protein